MKNFNFLKQCLYLRNTNQIKIHDQINTNNKNIVENLQTNVIEIYLKHTFKIKSKIENEINLLQANLEKSEDACGWGK